MVESGGLRTHSQTLSKDSSGARNLPLNRGRNGAIRCGSDAAFGFGGSMETSTYISGTTSEMPGGANAARIMWDPPARRNPDRRPPASCSPSTGGAHQQQEGRATRALGGAQVNARS